MKALKRSWRSMLLLAGALLFLSVAAGSAEPVLYLSATTPGHGSSLCTLDLSTGADTWVVSVALAGGGAANIYNGGLAYDPYADVLYATGYDSASVSTLYRIDRTTGVATAIGPTGPTRDLSSGGLAFDLRTRVLYATGEESEYYPKQATYLYTLDPLTGAATPVGYGPPGTYLYGLGYDPLSGQLYALGFWNWTNRSWLFTVDKASGTPSPVGATGVTAGRGLTYGGLAFHPVSHVLYAQGSVTASTAGLYSLNAATGAATLIGSFSSGSGTTDGGLMFIDNTQTAVLELPARSSLLRQNCPNPFNPSTTLRFELPEAGVVRLSVYDLGGRLIRTLVDGPLPAGSNAAVWDGSDASGRAMASGGYVARMQAGRRVEAVMMQLVR